MSELVLPAPLVYPERKVPRETALDRAAVAAAAAWHGMRGDARSAAMAGLLALTAPRPAFAASATVGGGAAAAPER